MGHGCTHSNQNVKVIGSKHNEVLSPSSESSMFKWKDCDQMRRVVSAFFWKAYYTRGSSEEEDRG